MNLSKLSNTDLLAELKLRLEMKENKSNLNQQLLDQLKEVNEKLKDAEAMKSHFISNITNEIVNPFSSILGLSKNISLVKDNGLDQAKKMASLIYSEAFDLDFQLKNIFAAAKIEAGQFIPEYSNVDIENLIKSVLDVYKFKSDQKQIKIEFSSKINTKDKAVPVFITDPEKLKLIISNLLSNSIKYSNITDKVKLETNIDTNKLIIVIRDYGIGIDKENMKIIFDRFRRGNLEINSMVRGHGLGLSIVKSSLDILNGDIVVKSKSGYGTQFTVTINKPENIENLDTFSTDSNEIFFEDEELF